MTTTYHRIIRQLYRQHDGQIEKTAAAYLKKVRSMRNRELVDKIILAHGRDQARKLRSGERTGRDIIIDRPPPSPVKQNDAARKVQEFAATYGYSYRLMQDGLALGDATSVELRAHIRWLRTLIDVHSKTVRWLEAISKKIPHQRKVRDCWSEMDLQRAAQRAGLKRI